MTIYSDTETLLVHYGPAVYTQQEFATLQLRALGFSMAMLDDCLLDRRKKANRPRIERASKFFKECLGTGIA